METLSIDRKLSTENCDWTLGVTRLQVNNSVFSTTKDDIKFEITKSIEKEEGLFSVEYLKNGDQKLRREGLKYETLGLVDSDKVKELEFDDVKTLRNILRSTEEQMEFIQPVTKLKVQYMRKNHKEI